MPGGGPWAWDGERTVRDVKKSLEHAPEERLRWRVLRAFQALPTEARVKDEEEAAALLCPSCRAEASLPRCPVCGRETGERLEEENPGFDMERFLQLREGEAP